MGEAGKRQEMVEDRCVQEMRVEVRCVKEFRVKVQLVKDMYAKVWFLKVVCMCERERESCVRVMWVKEWCGTGVGVKVLCVQGMRGKLCVSKNCE